MDIAQARKQSQPIADDMMDDDSLYETRMPTSTRRYKSPSSQRDTDEEPVSRQGAFIQRRRSSLQSTQGIASNAVAPSRSAIQQRQQRFPLVSILIGMIITIILIMCLSAFSSWWRTYQDDQHYGRPRTSQLDAVVGHGGDSANNPTHFIFMNLRRHVQIIEIPAGDPAHSRIFTGPVLYGDGQDLTPVTGEIRDANGDGKSDLIVHIQDQQFIFLNDGTTFHPQIR